MLRILVVDDSLIMRNVLVRVFESLGHKVVGKSPTGYDAIEKYKMLVPDLVTMDITMPMTQGIKNGVEALAKIKELDEFAKVVMVTSHGEQKLVLDSIKLGAKGYMLKPVTEEKVVELLVKVFPDNWMG